MLKKYYLVYFKMSKLQDVLPISLNDLIPINSKINFIIGGINSGKSTWSKILINRIKYSKLYLVVKDTLEWGEYEKRSIIHPNTFFKDIKSLNELKINSLIILDDFTLDNIYKDNFYKFIHFLVSHKQLTVFICVHTIFKNSLFSYILYNTSFFLTYSLINKIILKKIDNQYATNYSEIFNKGIINNFLNNYHIFYLNLNSNICIPTIDILFSKEIKIHKKIQMYKNNEEYYIFPVNEVNIKLSNEINDENENENENENNENTLTLINEMINKLYPKSKKMPLLCNILYNILNENIDINLNIIINNEKLGNVIDFVSYLQNPKKTVIPSKIKKILQFIKNKNVSIPKTFIRNISIHKYFNN